MTIETLTPSSITPLLSEAYDQTRVFNESVYGFQSFGFNEASIDWLPNITTQVTG